MELRIRRMQPEDLPAVMEIEKVAFTNPWSVEMVKKELTQDWSTVLLIEEHGAGLWRLRGFSIFWLVQDEQHVLNVATDPAQRRRGLGRRVMEATLEAGRAHRCRISTLEVRRGNVAATEMYRRLGFRPVGMRPNYYADDREDAVVMVYDFAQAAAQATNPA
ncbi:MAG: ribosomal protein S18-alanine N-acetyltransferase [Archangiaceae bacterium]|nr:ribosomal protein S18-alanine N-acetyltransferase [Archangiaceae bacterium]